MKICSKCKKHLDESMFNKGISTFDGLQSMCRKCHVTYFKKWYLKNKENVIPRVTKRKLIKKKSGICTRCGKNLIDYQTSMIHCQSCNNKVIEYTFLREKKLRENGLCITCGKRPSSIASTCRCDSCLEKRKYNRKNRKIYPNEINELLEVKKYMEKQNENNRNRTTK